MKGMRATRRPWLQALRWAASRDSTSVQNVLAHSATPPPAPPNLAWNTLWKKDSIALSYPAAAAPRFLGMLDSILARMSVQVDPTRHRWARPSCNTHHHERKRGLGEGWD
jgi:hypothetical protein